MSTELEQEQERGTQMRGFRYGLHDFVGQVDGVEALRKHNESTNYFKQQQGSIDRKTHELLAVIAITAQRGLVSLIQVHMHAAYRAGATPEEIREAIDVMAPFIGGISKVIGLEAWRKTFRPDVPSIDRVVELR